MDRSYILENNRERERLSSLVNEMSDEELTLTLYSEGWTIAAALAHIAFWDRRRLALVRKWKQNGVRQSPMDDDTLNIINDALVPFFLALPPRKAAVFSISIAGELDRELEELPLDLIPAINDLGDRHALNRSIHRKMHLDDIEALLQTKRRTQ